MKEQSDAQIIVSRFPFRGEGCCRAPLNYRRRPLMIKPTNRASPEGKPYNCPGALWGLRVLKFDGAIAPRVLKFDSGFAAEGCGGRHMDKPCGLEG